MSVVWRGHDEILGRPVAIKILNLDPNDATFAVRVRREAMAVAHLSHPHIATVYDYGESRDIPNPVGTPTPYIVMELVDGESLAQILKRGAMSWPTAVGVCAQIAAALAAAHQYGVVHRDITPGNIMLSADGVKVIDFGVAATTGDRSDGVVFGTPAYLAPERISGDLAQPATDVYGLGMVLYQCLTGRLPWPAGTTKELLSAHRYVPPAPMPPIPGMPLAVAELCQQCLCVDPSQRPGSGRAYVTLAEMARYGDQRALRTTQISGPQQADGTRVLTRFSPTSPTSPPPAYATFAVSRPPAHEPIDVDSSTIPIEKTRKRSRRQRRREHGIFILPSLLLVMLIGCLGLSQIRTEDGGAAGAAPSQQPANKGPTRAEPKLPAVTAPNPPKIGVADAPDAPQLTCRVSYKTTASWIFGYAALVTLANTSDVSISGWTLQFTLPKGDRINGGWNGKWSQSGRTVTVADLTYNATLSPGSAISLGFLGQDGSRDESGNADKHGRSKPGKATGFSLNGHGCTAA
jgi:serine/threonine-protein kinase